MNFCARTLPTPGSDSSTVDTSHLAERLVRLRLLQHIGERALAGLQLALHLGALLSRCRSLLECVGALLRGKRRKGHEQSPSRSMEGPGTREYTHGVRHGTNRVEPCDLRVFSAPRAAHRARRTDRIDRVRDGATDHQVVGTALDRVTGRQHADLIVTVRAGRTDARHDETEGVAARPANVADVVARHHHAVESRRLRLPCQRRGGRESSPPCDDNTVTATTSGIGTPASSAPRFAPSSAARIIASPPRACTLNIRTPSRAMLALARSTVFGMSCSLLSMNTGP